MAAVGEGARSPGVLDLYRAMHAAALDLVARYRLAIVLEVGLVLLYVFLRTGPFPRDVLVVWSLLVALLALVSPSSALVTVIAIGPFTEPFVLNRDLGVKPLLVGIIGLSIAVRLALELRRLEVRARLGVPRRAPAIALASAALIAVGTALGGIHTWIRFGAEIGVDVEQQWLLGIGGGLIVLGAAAWSAARGNLRPLAWAIGAGAVAGIVSLADWFRPELLRESPFAWLLRPLRITNRLTGVIPSPNGVASMVIVALAGLAATAAFARRPGLRIAALALSLPLLAALYYTFSRAALLGIFAIVVILAWRVRRWLGAGILVVGIVAGALLLPSYLAARFGAVGNEGEIDPSGLIVASDRMRLQAWVSAGTMFLERPLTGHGFLSYRELHQDYGDPDLRSPHNEWIRLFAEEGIVIGLAGLAFLVATALALARVPGAVGAAALAGFAGWAIAATFNNPTLFIQVGLVAMAVTGAGLGTAWRRTVAGHPPARP